MIWPALDQMLWLWAAPLALLPWWRWWPSLRAHPDLRLLDGRATAWDRALRLVASLAILSLLAGVAGLHWPRTPVPRVGTGAHVVVALDRSRSMDQPFASGMRRMEHRDRLRASSKSAVARQLLWQFVSSREHDHFGMVVFSTNPIPVVPLTPKQDMLRAAIDAAGIGRGLGDTNVGTGLREALSLFDGQPFTGSRIVLLVSDGAALLDREARREIRELLQQHRVALYWLYIRTANGPDINDIAFSDTPEWRLHHFFKRLETPYRGYSAEDPDAMADALDAIAQLHNLPLDYDEWIPRRDLMRWCFGLAALALGVLAIADALLWRGARDADR